MKARFLFALACCALACLLCAGAARADVKYEFAARTMVRLQVRAASDAPEDQALKLKVRDAVLEVCRPLLENCSSREDASAVLGSHLDEITRTAESVMRSEGSAYSVAAELAVTAFPTREYDGFALPAGQYTALRVVLGEGKGRNWWCVVFPPLCNAAATGNLEESALTAGLSEDEVKLITQENDGYILRFKCVEWFSKWFGKKNKAGT